MPGGRQLRTAGSVSRALAPRLGRLPGLCLVQHQIVMGVPGAALPDGEYL